MLVFLFVVVGFTVSGPFDGVHAEEPVAENLAAVSLMALEPVAGLGVVRLPDGELVLLAEGESLPGTEATVEEVLEDRLVLREELPEDPPRERILWMFPAESGGSSRLQVLDPEPPEEEPRLKPQSKEVDTEVEARPEG